MFLSLVVVPRKLQNYLCCNTLLISVVLFCGNPYIIVQLFYRDNVLFLSSMHLNYSSSLWVVRSAGEENRDQNLRTDL